jgi:predicted nucleotide-binding protein (sugar kinase/HSP70/actin superfamily)
VVGEIYVRSDPFANDFVIEKLESRGIRAQLAPFNEWLEYAEWCGREEGRNRSLGALLTRMVLYRCQELTYNALARGLGWPGRTTVPQVLAAAAPYLRSDLHGEAVLTLGGAVHEWRTSAVDGVVNVGPLECMPTKLAETQLFHVAECEGLPSVTLPFNGDPLDPEALDNFAFEVHRSFQRRRAV